MSKHEPIVGSSGCCRLSCSSTPSYGTNSSKSEQTTNSSNVSPPLFFCRRCFLAKSHHHSIKRSLQPIRVSRKGLDAPKKTSLKSQSGESQTEKLSPKKSSSRRTQLSYRCILSTIEKHHASVNESSAANKSQIAPTEILNRLTKANTQLLANRLPKARRPHTEPFHVLANCDTALQ